jgi:hypothetical protein
MCSEDRREIAQLKSKFQRRGGFIGRLKEELEKAQNLQVRMLRVDNWEGLYINGELKLEGHSLSVRDVIELFTNDLDTIWSGDDLERFGYRCPRSWNEVVENIEGE